MRGHGSIKCYFRHASTGLRPAPDSPSSAQSCRLIPEPSLRDWQRMRPTGGSRFLARTRALSSTSPAHNTLTRKIANSSSTESPIQSQRQLSLWRRPQITGRTSEPDRTKGKPDMQSNISPDPRQIPSSPVPTAVAKNEALYVILGLLIPGLPALLLKEDKVTGGIQLGLWVVSWVLAFFLIGFVLWIGVAIWSAMDGYQAAKLWNSRHGFVT